MRRLKWPLPISSMDGQQAEDMEATVDTGVSFTTLTWNLLRKLGIGAAGRTCSWSRAARQDGIRAEVVYYEGRHQIVVFGDNEAPALLGAYTLEGAWPWLWTRKLNVSFLPI